MSTLLRLGAKRHKRTAPIQTRKTNSTILETDMSNHPGLIIGGETAVTLTSASTLASLGVTVTALGSAKLNTSGPTPVADFPITGGMESSRGDVILHQGRHPACPEIIRSSSTNSESELSSCNDRNAAWTLSRAIPRAVVQTFGTNAMKRSGALDGSCGENCMPDFRCRSRLRPWLEPRLAGRAPRFWAPATEFAGR